MSGICHFQSLGSAFSCISFILKLAEGYAVRTSVTVLAERQRLVAGRSGRSSVPVSHGPELGQAPKPLFVTLIAQTWNRPLSLERGEGTFLYVYLFNCEI